MMRKIIFLAFLGLSCCTTDRKEKEPAVIQETTRTNSEFTKYLDLLPTLTLPFETNCEKCCDHLRIDHDNDLVQKFKPEGSAIVGLVSRTEDRAVILVTYPADMIIPSLKVYDMNGNLTGDMNFMTNYCGGEPGFYSSQFLRIDTNVAVSQIDSLYETSFDSLTYQTIDTTDIKVTRKNFKINEKGAVVEDD